VLGYYISRRQLDFEDEVTMTCHNNGELLRQLHSITSRETYIFILQIIAVYDEITINSDHSL
jgi:hypothetical protein